MLLLVAAAGRSAPLVVGGRRFGRVAPLHLEVAVEEEIEAALGGSVVMGAGGGAFIVRILEIPMNVVSDDVAGVYCWLGVAWTGCTG